MQRAHVLSEQRKHPCAPLRLSARVRWRGPLGMRLEVTETIDISREGVLLRSREDPTTRTSRAWIVFPFDSADASAIEPETPARVVRAEREGDDAYRVGLHLEPPHRPAESAPAQGERRACPRVALCLPIFVRADGTPWPEETMTRDFSRTGVMFETPHVYAAGGTVRARIPWGEWAEAAEISGRVMRVNTAESCLTLGHNHSGAAAAFNWVAVEWMQPTPRKRL